ncbi:cytochrome o ubiquinol oxidase subunit I [Pseudomonas sp. 148P]|uniref:Cytochrome bo(3) ubiquinol oxidase subunit 1 n=1 Tax=Pseudomonas ulcerans TaxID=3115852 RepID=A0ABU7HVG8_9PSED|nr:MULTISPECIES: cytochrome o ubiquinol oxidase subunit I [unclassified Pseudomonas]MEE1924113.1 cytochrome o ubiquinol oxidase subunit I [Pseudomonas sp. 147P]MEE1935560.1 cytochrome o ubiquinol oxidase subunit I [Pseudomonas sp. 148P]
MFGKLSWDAIPVHDTLIMTTLAVVGLIGLAVLVAITWQRRWTWLWREWLTSVDHKRIGVMYIVAALVMLLRGFADALLMRTQQAMASGGSAGYLPPDHYDQIFTAHGTIMIFFMAMPLLIGLMNIVVPLQIGARDLAFPFLNAVSFWLFVAGALLVNISLGVGEFARTGWVAYPPLSGIDHSPGVGVDYWIWSLQIAGVGTLLTGVNFFVTIIRMRTTGMTLFRMPVFTWTALCTMVLILAAFPILTATLLLLSLDRYLGMHIFTTDLGGNPMMYINLIWAWGHPEVYILILPAFGVFSEVVSTFAGKRLFGYHSLVWASIVITVLSFVVWAHHFFTMGAGASVNAFFGIMTMVIAVPTGVKIFTWLFTLFRGRLRFETPMLWTLGFIVTFSIGGMSGVLLAVPGADFLLHNSLFLVAHFHNVIIGGAVFGYLCGLSYWFSKAFGFRLHERSGRAAFWCWLVGFYFAFMPSYVLGFMGMTRRLNAVDVPEWRPLLLMEMLGVAIILCGVGCQLAQLLLSFRQRHENRDHTGDPWNGRTLEWATASPPPVYNFAVRPVVEGIDAYWGMKERGVQAQAAADYQPIYLPHNTSLGLVIGLSSLLLGFAMVWHIWWLALASLLGTVATLVLRSSDEQTGYWLPVEVIERTEREWRATAKNPEIRSTCGD